jgi:iron complex outermembrane receptor protein
MESSVEMRLERSRYFVDRTIRRICLAGSVAAVMLAGTPTFAADAAATDSAATDSEGAPVLQEVVVTGSLLSRPNAETAEAITVISTESLKDQGITTTEQALQQITSNISGDYSTQSSVSTYTGGGSYADLRGLGRSHTLVLLDG